MKIITKAINKAKDNGFKTQEFSIAVWWIPEQKIWYFEGGYESIIFNQDFAKTLWPRLSDDKSKVNNWSYHLKNMVVADDQLKYLSDNI